MGRKYYSKEQHEEAWLIYYEKRTYQSVSDAMGLDYGTVQRWAKEDFACPHHGCSYHNWDQMIEEKDLAVEAKLRLYEDGNVNPIAHEQAIEQAMNMPNVADASEAERRKRLAEVERRRKVIESLVRSDFERLAQWELIWSKAIFQITGQVLDYDALVDMEGNPLAEEEVRKLLSRGLKLTSLEGGVRALKEIQGMIEDLKEKLNLQKKLGNEDIGTGQDRKEERPAATIEDLRHFKSIWENTPEEQRHVLVKMFKADERALEALGHGQGSSGVSPAAGTADSVPLPPA